MTFPVRSLLLLTVTTALLAACGDVRQDLGLGRNPPDEFSVMERPPLSMPPDFALRPPRPGAPRPQNIDTTSQAKASVFSAQPVTAQAPSEGEQALLAAAGATKADANIRDTVDKESAEKTVASPHLVQRLLDGSSDGKPATTVDAEAEAARIKQAQQNNQPVAAGATPVIEKQSGGWLGL